MASSPILIGVDGGRFDFEAVALLLGPLPARVGRPLEQVGALLEVRAPAIDGDTGAITPARVNRRSRRSAPAHQVRHGEADLTKRKAPPLSMQARL